jgi:hypothetical protein
MGAPLAGAFSTMELRITLGELSAPPFSRTDHRYFSTECNEPDCVTGLEDQASGCGDSRRIHVSNKGTLVTNFLMSDCPFVETNSLSGRR